MLTAEQTYAHPDGRGVKIVMPLDEQSAIGEIYFATLTFGPMKVSIQVTEQGLLDAGFVAEAPTEPE